METNVRVAVRSRPLSKKEINRMCASIVSMPDSKRVKIRGVEGHEGREFTFDYCYNSESTQEQVYKDLGEPMVSQALEGYNGTLFAYGQTGSGKTWSMMGAMDDPVNKGVIPRLNDDLFIKIDDMKAKINAKSDSKSETKFMCTVTFLEIYNEILKDLLNPGDKQLKIRENPEFGIYVEDLCELVVENYADVMKLLNQGNTVRKVAATNMNEASSRSHSVFTLKIEQKTVQDMGEGMSRETFVRAKINLVDLAGSERAAKTGAKGATLKEGANINLSLMALGNVINALSEGGAGKKHIPYRDSKLTRLLQESLGGNANTVMLAAIGPADYNYDETMGTLKYAHRAKSIENAVTKNEDMQERMIKDLQAQIELLKAQLEGSASAGIAAVDTEEQLRLKEELQKMEDQNKSSWEEKQRLSKLLEEERNQNVNAVIGNMMQTVKDKKVTHMKNIKRLMLTKTELTQKQKAAKETNAELKKKLDINMERYTKYQEKLDKLSKQATTPEVEAEMEKTAATMNKLIQRIENDRTEWMEKREVLKQLKEKLINIEEEVTDERAELVATSGILEQNDKLRQQIQEEERIKAQDLIQSEIKAAKDLYEKEKETVRGSIEAEMSDTISKMQGEIMDYKFKFETAEKEEARLKETTTQLQGYIDTLENRATDAEVQAEEAAARIAGLENENKILKEEGVKLSEKNAALEEQMEARHVKHRKEMEDLKKKIHDEINGGVASFVKQSEEKQYQMFQVMMDGFEKEREAWSKKHHELQSLMQQATNDLMYTLEENENLKIQLQQAINYEPDL